MPDGRDRDADALAADGTVSDGDGHHLPSITMLGLPAGWKVKRDQDRLEGVLNPPGFGRRGFSPLDLKLNFKV